MQDSHNVLSTGLPVTVRGGRWVVLDTMRYGDVGVVTLRGADAENQGHRATVITPFDRVHPSSTGTSLRHRSRRTVTAAALLAAADVAAWDSCWTAPAAAIDLHEWQMAPARAAVRGTMRLLLADEVGLGKTIQAGLIVSELRARGLVERVLVLTPASIRHQWATELQVRFGLDATVLDQTALAAAAAVLPPDVNPWRTAALTISSIDLVKRPEVRSALETVPLDVLIVDEAHHLSPGSDRAAVVADLARRCLWVVLITATPHAGDDAAYALLQKLGDVGSEDVHVFRRSRVPATRVASRRSHLLFLRPTEAERALLEETTRYVRACSRARTPGGRLVASVIARRAASSPEAAYRTLMRRLTLLGPGAEPPPQWSLPWDEQDADNVPDAALASPALADVDDERRWIVRLAELARAAASASSKCAALRRLLRRTREPVVVFSEYRDVVLLVAAAIDDIGQVRVLHGGLSARERVAAVRAFTEGDVRVLVATDAAGEGLNLHRRCRLVINLELPWMPRRLEQRIGRVDRIGQTRRVHAIQLAHAGSYEGTVIARLERRRARALAASPSVPAVEAAPREHAVRRAYHLAPRACRIPPAGAYSSRRRARGAALLVVYDVPLLDGGGSVVLHHTVACRIECRMENGRLTRTALRAVQQAPVVLDVVSAEGARAAVSLQRTLAPAATAILRRLTAVARSASHVASGAIWQGSLFDRRAEQHARRRRQAMAEIDAQLERRRNVVQDLTTITAARPRLVAAWLE